jgi:hypothetical protein
MLLRTLCFITDLRLETRAKELSVFLEQLDDPLYVMMFFEGSPKAKWLFLVDKTIRKRRMNEPLWRYLHSLRASLVPFFTQYQRIGDASFLRYSVEHEGGTKSKECGLSASLPNALLFDFSI